MPLPWKKSQPSRISRFVSDLQQSPKHGGSLVVETGFPTSLIDLFVKNRDRLKKSSSKCSNSYKTQTQTQTAPKHSHLIRHRSSSPPPPPPLSLQRRRSLPQKLDLALLTENPSVSKIEESFVAENRHDGDNEDDGANGGNRGGGGCVLMVVVFKVFVVAVLALSTKKLAVGITLSAFALLFLELAVARVFTLLNLCPDAAQIRLDSLIGKLIGNRRNEEEEEEESSSSTQERRNKVSFKIIEEAREEIRAVHQSEKKSNGEDSSTLEKAKPVGEEKMVQTIRDVVFKNEKSKSAKLKSKIVKKIVPKKLRSYKKKKKMKKKMKEREEEEEVEVVEEEGYVSDVSSLFSDERIESEISEERDDVGSNLPLLESCGDEEEEEEEGEEIGSKGDITKVMVLVVIILAGLLSGKVFAIGLTLSCCLILRVSFCKSQTSL